MTITWVARKAILDNEVSIVLFMLYLCSTIVLFHLYFKVAGQDIEFLQNIWIDRSNSTNQLTDELWPYLNPSQLFFCFYWAKSKWYEGGKTSQSLAHLAQNYHFVFERLHLVAGHWLVCFLITQVLTTNSLLFSSFFKVASMQLYNPLRRLDGPSIRT